MIEEQEPASLTDDTSDETIKIPRVKPPANGHSSNGHINKEYHSNRHHVSSPENVLTQKPEKSPYFEALIAEETAKMPSSLANGNGTNKSNNTSNDESAISEKPSPVETHIADKDEATDTLFTEPPVTTATPTAPHSLSPISALPAPRPISAALRPVVRLWKFSRLLFIGIILLPIVAVSMYASVQLSQVQSGLYTVDAHSGAILWQHPLSSTARTVYLDASGSIQIAQVNGYEQQLIALDAHGNTVWKSFVGDGTFTIPTIAATPDAVVAALNQQSAVGNTLTLYSFDRATGHVNWQYPIAQPIQIKGAAIAGSDSNFIYTISTQPLSGNRTQVQLLAINRFTGYVAWRVTSPAESNSNSLDGGNVLLSGQYLIWQVAETIQVVDTAQGNMLWHTYLPSNDDTTIQQEETQMAVLHGQLIVERNDGLQAFTLATGKQLWSVAAFSFSTGAVPAGIAAAAQSLLVYGNGQIAAININTRQIMWQQRQVGNLLSLHVSNDGRLVYVILLDSVENSTPAQALVALDTANGAARWTFQPYSGIDFLNPQSDGFQYHAGIILTAFCLTATQNTCNHPRLYALNATTGDTLWQFQGDTVSNALMSLDGSIVTYKGKTSAWDQFTAGLRG